MATMRAVREVTGQSFIYYINKDAAFATDYKAEFKQVSITRRILDVITNNPGIRPCEISAKVGTYIHPVTLGSALTRLIRRGYIAREYKGGKSRYWASVRLMNP
jgi:hypothetical protein